MEGRSVRDELEFIGRGTRTLQPRSLATQPRQSHQPRTLTPEQQHHHQSIAGFSATPEIMVFHPTTEEFKDFNKYIRYMESKGAHLAGLAKVIPPSTYKPRVSGNYEDIDLKISAPIAQYIYGSSGHYQVVNIARPSTTVKEYRKLAESPPFAPPPSRNHKDLERKYWKQLTYNKPVYGADVCGTLTDPFCSEWNINKLGSILDIVSKNLGTVILGVNTAYLYFGMWKATFCWHVEDMDLYSINYLHHGAPKTWYAIPPQFGKRFEEFAKWYFPEEAASCSAFLRHKQTVLSPELIREAAGIPVQTITQEEGEIMVTFPYGYHSGFNHGFNIAESTNFASERWVEFGKRASRCRCRPDSVRIEMDPFVRRFQPQLYERWLAGNDFGVHPSNPFCTRQTLALPPSLAVALKRSTTSPAAAARRRMGAQDKRARVEGEEQGDMQVEGEEESCACEACYPLSGAAAEEDRGGEEVDVQEGADAETEEEVVEEEAEEQEEEEADEGDGDGAD